MSGRRHLLPSAVPLRTQRATFTAYGSSLYKGIVGYPATYKAVRAGSFQELRACLFDFLLAKYSWY
ncbi:hypothetical protein C9I89_07445 [Photobacterium lipolyticum]|uniref:Uncharacterized protein n=1 Tax=Photobacterium lipolyticum TaxID=266810 RepID=A0A2T3N231_9GAMM|nr:hypothetical protein C9I89_07445 [Photobacterium lipolyticum]